MIKPSVSTPIIGHNPKQLSQTSNSFFPAQKYLGTQQTKGGNHTFELEKTRQMGQ
jgi:hypothetical protein